MAQHASSPIHRLPKTVIPTHYDLTIKTNLRDFTTKGTVVIRLSVIETTSEIALHSSQLHIEHVFLTNLGVLNGSEAITPVFDEEREFVKFTLDKPLRVGTKAELKIAFSGKINDSLVGYFKSSYEFEGKTRYCAITQFCPMTARKAFPCWDEPEFKARFSITLTSPADLVNLSNMPIMSEEPLACNCFADYSEADEDAKKEGWKATKFQESPLMSPYLVAFAVGDFQHLETMVTMPISNRLMPLRAYATPDALHQTSLLLDVAAAALPRFEQLFNVEYPLPKLDTLVVAHYNGASENWGLVIGNKNSFLFDSVHPNAQSKRLLTSTLCHEVAHMWFGDSTTLKWWDSLYLNEGFATVMGEIVLPDKLFPEMRATSEFISSSLENALNVDAKISSHPIQLPGVDSDTINQIFDALSYSKAGAILRMLYSHLGGSDFLRGVSIYLKKHAFSNTETKDLWDALSAATKIDVAGLMNSWATQIGFPMLTVKERDGNIFIRQDRFLETGPANAQLNETLWKIPVTITSYSNGTPTIRKLILDDSEASILMDTTEPYKLNSDTTGFYRVLYSPERSMLIAKQALNDDSHFTANDKIGFLQDSFAMSRAGYSNIGTTLTLVDLWRNQRDYYVWKVIGANLSQMVSIWWENTDAVKLLNRLRRGLFVPLVQKYGYEYPVDESVDVTLLRTLAIEQTAGACDESVTLELRSRFQYFIKTGDASKIPGDLQRITFITAAIYGGEKEYDAIFKVYRHPQTPAEKVAAIWGMCSSRDRALLTRTWSILVGPTKVPDSDMPIFFNALAFNHHGRRFLTEQLKEHYNIIHERLGEGFFLGRTIKIAFENYSSQEDYASAEKFFEAKDISRYSQAATEALESIHARALYVERSTPDLMQWLKENKKDGGRR